MKTPAKLGADVVIIGGGIVGCAAAYYLARRGRKVVLLEKSAVGGEASGRNGGGVRAQCRDRRERPLAIASIQLWTGLEKELDCDFEYIQGGNIRLATNDARMDMLRKEGEEELADGLAVELWDRDQLRRRAPYLTDVFVGAKYCPIDGCANPLLAAPAIARGAKRAGAAILTRTEAVDIGRTGGRVSSVTGRGKDGEVLVETPWVIHAAGPWTPHLSAALGIRVPIEPARSVLAITERVPRLLQEFVSSHDLGAYCRQARAGNIHIGGVGAPGITFDQTMPTDAVGRLAAAGARLLPAIHGAGILRTWSGTLENTPDKVPILDTVSAVPGYVLASGFSGHGFCLGPIAGKLLSEWIVDGAPSIPLHDFRLARFEKPTY